jgi:hypothetical protein
MSSTGNEITIAVRQADRARLEAGTLLGSDLIDYSNDEATLSVLRANAPCEALNIFHKRHIILHTPSL